MKKASLFLALLVLCFFVSCIPGVTTKVVTVKNSTGGTLCVDIDSIGQPYKTKLYAGETKNYIVSRFTPVSKDSFFVYGKNKIIDELDISEGGEFLFTVEADRSWIVFKNGSANIIDDAISVHTEDNKDTLVGLPITAIPEDFIGINGKHDSLAIGGKLFFPIEKAFGKEAKALYTTIGKKVQHSIKFIIPQPGNQITVELK